MILEAGFVSPEGRGFRHQPGLHEDGVVPGLRQAAEQIHAEGALAGPGAARGDSADTAHAMSA